LNKRKGRRGHQEKIVGKMCLILGEPIGEHPKRWEEKAHKEEKGFCPITDKALPEQVLSKVRKGLKGPQGKSERGKNKKL